MIPSKNSDPLDNALKAHYATRSAYSHQPNMNELNPTLWDERKGELDRLTQPERIRYAKRLEKLAREKLERVFESAIGTQDRVDNLYRCRYAVKYLVLALTAVDLSDPEIALWRESLDRIEKMLQTELGE